jgi:hypothetical protein
MPNPTPFEAHLQEPYVVLGVRLRPLTIGHAILLHRLGGAAFFEHGQSVTFDELALGVVVCSSESWASFTGEFYGGKIAERIIALADSCKSGDIDAEITHFCEYLTAGMQGPKLLIEESDTRTLGAHFLQILRVQMKRIFRTSELDVMDVPIAVALWDISTVMELDNQGKIWTDADDELKRKADEFDAALRAKGGFCHG